jgi:chaperonin GroES
MGVGSKVMSAFRDSRGGRVNMATATRSKKRKAVKLQPLGDRVLVEREEAEKRTAGGIVLPDKARDKSKRGKVLSVGNGKLNKDGKRFPLTVKPGDRVLFSGYSGEEIKTDGREVLLIREDDILAVIHD